MDSIIVGVSRPKAFFEPFSWLIRLVTWSSVSHAYIRFYEEDYDRWLIYQASGLKVNFIGKMMFDGAEIVYKEFTVPVSDLTKKVAVQNAIDRCGDPYSVLQVIGYGAVLIARLFRKKIHNPFYSGSSFVCSELVAEILREIAGEEAEDIDPSTMTPRDILEFMLSKGFLPVSNG